MRAAFATLVFTALVAANPMPQAVTSAIAPNQSSPPGCSPNYDGTFEIGPVNISSSTKRSLDQVCFDPLPTCPVHVSTDVHLQRNTQLGITLKNGILTDPQGRTGYIAANEQFQFDGPPQAGAIWTAGFSVCQNGSLALGSDVIWWKCLSGDFYNLYFKSIGGQCIESYLITHPVGGAGGPAPISNSPTTSTTGTTSAASGSASSTSGASSSGVVSTTATNGTMTGSSSGQRHCHKFGHHYRRRRRPPH